MNTTSTDVKGKQVTESSTKVFQKVNSHNEWDSLKEIIVGTAEGSMGVITWNKPGAVPEEKLEKAYELARQAFPEWFLDEIREDLDGLCKVIEDFGATVHRPTVFDLTNMYSTAFWSSTSNNIYNTRDLNLVVGNNVIESPSYMRSRYYETTALYPIWYNYFESGFKWIAGPKPRLDEKVLVPYERELTEEDRRFNKLTKGRTEILHKLREHEILFEAANTLRMGKDLLYLVSCSGNYLGAKWLQSVLGDDYRVHTTEEIYRSAHIDSTVLAIKPGLVMLNDIRVNEKTCPKLFDKWEKVWFSDVAPTSDVELDFQKTVRDPLAKQLEELGFETNLSDMSSPWVGMNFLSLDQETVVVDERQTALIKKLEEYKLTVIPIRMRHIYTQGGGIHCATLDTVRDSKLESYFD